MLSPSIPEVCVEWAPFELRSGASESDLIEAAEQLQNGFLELQPGFVRRELLRGDGRRWVDLIVWANRGDAERAAARVGASDACRAYFSLMHDTEAGIQHFSRAWHCGPAGSRSDVESSDD
jgi:hypothetical protein